MQYSVPGSTDLVKLVQKHISSIPVSEDHDWGLDYGGWSKFCRMHPNAVNSVVQLSLNRQLPLESHYQLGRELRLLRDEGILILGSGSMAHNLRLVTWADAGSDWATAYAADLKGWILTARTNRWFNIRNMESPRSFQ